jgi:hypothetical protein
MRHVRTDPIHDREGDFGAILRGVNVHSKRTVAKGHLTIFAIASPTSEASASSGAMAEKASMIFFRYPLPTLLQTQK